MRLLLAFPCWTCAGVGAHQLIADLAGPEWLAWAFLFIITALTAVLASDA